MEPKWIVRRGEAESTPLTYERLIRYADSRRLRRSDMVRGEDQRDWRRAEEVPGLFISRLFCRLATLAVAAAISILITVVVRANAPLIWGHCFHGLVYGLYKGGLILGYDTSGYGGLMAAAALGKGSRTDQWLPWIMLLRAGPGLIPFIYLPLWVPGTILLSIPGLLRPRRYSPQSLVKELADFIRLEPPRSRPQPSRPSRRADT